MIDPKKRSEKKILNGLLDRFLYTDGRTAADILKRASASSGLPVGFLAANAFQEGMGNAIREFSNPDSPVMYHKKVAGENPVNGFEYYGLDNFARVADKLKDKKYIRKDMQYDTFDDMNEKGQQIISGKFANNQDALEAKAGMLKDFRDTVREYSDKKGFKMNPKTEQYLTMAAYNGGFGNAKIMIDEMASGKVNQDEYVDKGLTSRKGVHKNIAPRMEKMSWFDNMLSGPLPGKQQSFPNTPTLFDALYRK